ncbi:hypothetical protein P7K49_030206, partial [Saguinus oedipus]
RKIPTEESWGAGALRSLRAGRAPPSAIPVPGPDVRAAPLLIRSLGAVATPAPHPGCLQSPPFQVPAALQLADPSPKPYT